MLLEHSLDQQDISLNLADLLHAATFVTCDAADFDRPPVHELLDVDIVDVDEE